MFEHNVHLQAQKLQVASSLDKVTVQDVRGVCLLAVSEWNRFPRLADVQVLRLTA